MGDPTGIGSEIIVKALKIIIFTQYHIQLLLEMKKFYNEH